jgi:hypothetical protein
MDALRRHQAAAGEKRWHERFDRINAMAMDTGSEGRR